MGHVFIDRKDSHGAAKARGNHQGRTYVVSIHQARRACGVDARDQIEVAGVDERRNQSAALHRAIAVVHREADVPDIEVERVPVQQQKERGDEQQRHQRAGVAPDLSKLLPGDGHHLAHG